MLFRPKTNTQNPTPYIFFDVDGVLNNEDDWHKYHFYINESCLSVFSDFVNTIHKKYKLAPKLVTCSTWRAGFNNKEEAGTDTNSILEKKFQEKGLRIDDATPISRNKTRQEEIEYYMRRHNVEKYIIIDDDASLYGNIDDINLYVPDYKTGLTKQDIKRMEKQYSNYKR